jgi:hypothetical protein
MFDHSDRWVHTHHMAIKLTEKDLQRHIYTVLINIGYTPMETGKARSMNKCNSCGRRQYATGWQGNTVGLPDLYIHSMSWPRGMAIAIELKTEKGEVREKQKEYNEKGFTYICRSIGSVLRVLIEVENRLGNDIEAEKLKKVIELNGF